MQAAKDTAGEIAASAKSGVDKTKVTIQGQLDKVTAHTPADRAAAEIRKELEGKERAEIDKRAAKHYSDVAAERGRGGGGFDRDVGGDTGAGGLDYCHHPTYTSTEHGSGYPTGGDMTSGVVLPDTLGAEMSTGGGTTDTTGYDPLTGTGGGCGHGDRPSYA